MMSRMITPSEENLGIPESLASCQNGPLPGRLSMQSCDSFLFYLHAFLLVAICSSKVHSCTIPARIVAIDSRASTPNSAIILIVFLPPDHRLLPRTSLSSLSVFLSIPHSSWLSKPYSPHCPITTTSSPLPLFPLTASKNLYLSPRVLEYTLCCCPLGLRWGRLMYAEGL